MQKLISVLISPPIYFIGHAWPLFSIRSIVVEAVGRALEIHIGQEFLFKASMYYRELSGCSVNTKHLCDIYTKLAQRLRRWSNIVKKVLYKCLVLTDWDR